ncbi:aKG-HExxH-type peptide beta-hydroxylase [Streptomyces sp. NPDC003042]
MHVEPDTRGAVADRTALLERMRGVLDRAELPPPKGGSDGLRHPAAVELVHTVQGALRSGPLPPQRRRTFADRLERLPAPSFGPAEPQGHLSRSVARALKAVPPAARGDGQPVTVEVAAWRGAEREVLAEAVRLLTRVWPESAAETRETVTEVALLEGDAIDGFTDFTVHGAVLINRTRLTTSAAGLPAAVRCAEALVHEGAHTRCNAAALTRPFLLPDPSNAAEHPDRPGDLLVATPLRADPRPLTGLFQQTVVLARSVLFYRRLGALGPQTDARRDRLVGSAHQAVTTLTAHAGRLTPHGRQVLAECAAVLERTA